MFVSHPIWWITHKQRVHMCVHICTNGMALRGTLELSTQGWMELKNIAELSTIMKDKGECPFDILCG